MYVITAYNLSDMQKGIQAAHAIIQYGFVVEKRNKKKYKKIYDEWVENWETIIILNGGTTCSTDDEGDLQRIRKDLKKLGVVHSVFEEPDLNYAETAAAFIVDMEEDSHVLEYMRKMNLA